MYVACKYCGASLDPALCSLLALEDNQAPRRPVGASKSSVEIAKPQGTSVKPTTDLALPTPLCSYHLHATCMNEP